jgi:hypothetical protein
MNKAGKVTRISILSARTSVLNETSKGAGFTHICLKYHDLGEIIVIWDCRSVLSPEVAVPVVQLNMCIPSLVKKKYAESFSFIFYAEGWSDWDSKSPLIGCLVRWPCVLSSRSPAVLIAGIACSNPAEGMDVRLSCLLCVVYIATSATSWSLVQGSPTWCVCV